MPQHRPISRHELLRLGKRLKFADRAVTILERKRDVLIFEFMDLLDRRRTLRNRLEAEYAVARQRLRTAWIHEGEITLHEAAETRAVRPELLVTEWNLRSVRVPMFLSRGVRTTLPTRGYGIIGSDSTLDEVVNAHERVLETAIRAAEMDAVLRVLTAEIAETSRRVNVLEHRLIPDIEAERKTLERRLAEREREERLYQRIAKRRRGVHRAERRGQRAAGGGSADENESESESEGENDATGSVMQSLEEE